MIGKATIYLVLILAGLSLFVFGSHLSYTIDQNASKGAKDKELELSAAAWGIFDPYTGEIIEGVNLSKEYPIASVTKLFTAYAALQSAGIDTATVIDWNDLYTEGRAGKLSYGEVVTPRELLFPLLIESSNDAGEAIRVRLGEEFSRSLSEMSVREGLVHTRIVDGSGLSALNVSTVEELARFLSVLERERPHILDITELRMYIGKKTGWINNNPARSFEEFRGGKHGFTPEAGRTFVGRFAVGGEGALVGVALLGSENLAEDLAVILSDLKNSE